MHFSVSLPVDVRCSDQSAHETGHELLNHACHVCYHHTLQPFALGQPAYCLPCRPDMLQHGKPISHICTGHGAHSASDHDSSNAVHSRGVVSVFWEMQNIRLWDSSKCQFLSEYLNVQPCWSTCLNGADVKQSLAANFRYIFVATVVQKGIASHSWPAT